jgi:hypothetical protein
MILALTSTLRFLPRILWEQTELRQQSKAIRNTPVFYYLPFTKADNMHL